MKFLDSYQKYIYYCRFSSNLENRGDEEKTTRWRIGPYWYPQQVPKMRSLWPMEEKLS